VHLRHVPLRTMVKLPHSGHASPSKPLSLASRASPKDDEGVSPSATLTTAALAMGAEATAGPSVSVALGETPSSSFGLALEARLKGFEGDACPECGNFTMVRNGTCLKCTTCGGTTGCS